MANGKTYFKMLAREQQYLPLTDKQYVKAIYFSNEQRKEIQIGATTYGKAHEIRDHTINLIKEKLTVKAYRENPDALLDGTYDSNDRTMVIAELMHEYKDLQPKPDGSLMLDVTIKRNGRRNTKVKECACLLPSFLRR